MVRNFFSLVTRHWISLVGSVIALVGALLMVMFFALELSGFHGGPYLGILSYLILPGVFVVGLALIPIGVVRKRRQDAAAAAHHEAASKLPIIDLNDSRTRGLLLASVAVGLVSAVILAGATYKGVDVMESVPFCGTVCHTVMQPEYTAFQRSPHSHLRCADCHIGAGAGWFVKSKLSGSWQMVSVALKLYPTPIPSPVTSLRPARETCEECHWPSKHVGDKLVVHSHFAEDETNSETKSVLLMKVGGQEGTAVTGIHWHVGAGVNIKYLSDPSRQTIYEVVATTPDGKTRDFKSKEDKPTGSTEWRTMDCVDCHNRPAHTFGMPSDEINTALEDGRIDKTLPFVKREGMRVLKIKFNSHEEARAGIAKEIGAFYAKTYPDLATTKAAAVAAAGKTLGDIYAGNIFPAMKVDWGTYPVNIGHDDSPGCMRCHDKKHVTTDGQKITGSCNVCHAVLADDEKDPAIMKALVPAP